MRLAPTRAMKRGSWTGWGRTPPQAPPHLTTSALIGGPGPIQPVSRGSRAGRAPNPHLVHRPLASDRSRIRCPQSAVGLSDHDQPHQTTSPPIRGVHEALAIRARPCVPHGSGRGAGRGDEYAVGLFPCHASRFPYPPTTHGGQRLPCGRVIDHPRPRRGVRAFLRGRQRVVYEIS
jgi:hypothetical protein